MGRRCWKDAQFQYRMRTFLRPNLSHLDRFWQAPARLPFFVTCLRLRFDFLLLSASCRQNVDGVLVARASSRLRGPILIFHVSDWLNSSHTAHRHVDTPWALCIPQELHPGQCKHVKIHYYLSSCCGHAPSLKIIINKYKGTKINQTKTILTMKSNNL